MDRLKNIIAQYGRWQPLSNYVERVETYLLSDFSLSLENSKSLLETIAREICDAKGAEISKTASTNAILKKAFNSLGYSSGELVTQVSAALATIGQQMGNLRNEIGTTSHGKTLEEIKERNNRVDELTREFLIDTTVIVAAFLIRNFESTNPRKSIEAAPLYIENPDFNEYLDSAFGEFPMGEITFTASEILYNLDIDVYLTELRLYLEQKDDEL